MSQKIVGIDIGGTQIKYGCLDETGTIFSKGVIDTPKKGEEILDALVTIFEGYNQDHDVKAVGISAPGIINNEGYLITGGAIYDFYDFDLRAEMMRRVGVEVFVENDANCALYAEKWIGIAKKCSNFILVVIGTGVGGAIMIHDKLYRGAHFSAGEFGFMFAKNPKDTDARRSSWSLVGSVQSGIVDAYKTLKNDGEGVSGLEVYNRALQGDSIAKQVMDDLYTTCAQQIYNLIVSFDPELVVISGAISGNKEFIQKVNQKVNDMKNTHQDMGNIVFPEIVASQYLNDSGIIGAAYNAIKQ